MSSCTPACWTQVDCTVCCLRKVPRGRDPGLAGGNDYCDSDCIGYLRPPLPPHLWHEHDDARRFSDDEWADAHPIGWDDEP